MHKRATGSSSSMIFADQAASLKKFYYKLFFGTPCMFSDVCATDWLFGNPCWRKLRNSDKSESKPKKRRLNRLNTLRNPQILSISYPTPRGMCLSIISFVSSWINEAKTIFLLYLIWKKCIFDHVLQYMMQFSNTSSVLMFRSYHKIWQKKLLSILFQSLTILQCLVGWNINCLNIYSSLS